MNFWDIVLVPIALFIGIIVVGIIFWGGAALVAVIGNRLTVRKVSREKSLDTGFAPGRRPTSIRRGKIAWA